MKIENLKNTSTREVLFIEVTNEIPLPDGKKSILGKNGILTQVINAHHPFIPKNGGVGDLGFVIITPKKEYFYAFDYSKDLNGWKHQITRGAEILDVKIGQIREKQFQILHGNIYLLSDCKFEDYNFYIKDNTGKLIIHKNRRALDKTGVLVEKILQKEIYKTINGKDYTKEEWEAYEKEEYRKYIEKKNKKSFSFFVEEDKTPQNFSAETGRLQNVEYIVFNSRANQVPVYQYPSTMVAPISFLDNGTAVQVLKYEKDGWCEVISKNQKKGYIHSSFVKKNN